ncbi:MAG TPA: glycosyltransferase [Longimicrobiales bacterium]|nr:glycosyltransferase [Longimicrobiales bacterium]
MTKRIKVESARTLDDYERYPHMAPAVAQLREEAVDVARALRGRTVWMINSTARGGGVSEMLPGMVAHLRELGLAVEWAVIEAGDDAFFQLTKRIHNLIHGQGETGLGAAERETFEATNRTNAAVLSRTVKDGDVLVVHDPQPMPLAGMLCETRDLTTIWRCHIGLDVDSPATRDAWRFLEPYADAYDHAVFSAPEYVAPYFEGRSSIIYPAIDPLTPKNRPLSVQAVIGILARAGLVREEGPRAEPPFAHQATRLAGDGRFLPASDSGDMGLLARPIITQVSRWDRLKGFAPLLRGFAEFKRQLRSRPPGERVAPRLNLARLVLAGPDPESVADDPEAGEVLDELRAAYRELDAEVQQDVDIIALPMHDPIENALIVNALQRVSAIIVQNSLREGFGLTITEAMWKAVPVLTNSRACGPRQQVRDGVEGRMIRSPENVSQVAGALRSMLSQTRRLEQWGLNGQRQVHDHFLIHAQLCHWLRLARRLMEGGRR